MPEGAFGAWKDDSFLYCELDALRQLASATHGVVEAAAAQCALDAEDMMERGYRTLLYMDLQDGPGLHFHDHPLYLRETVVVVLSEGGLGIPAPEDVILSPYAPKIRQDAAVFFPRSGDKVRFANESHPCAPALRHNHERKAFHSFAMQGIR
jgi:hypothetical protein